MPVGFLDNDFSDPDLERYLERFEETSPSVAVIGDAYTTSDAREFNQTIQELREYSPNKTYVIVPKCREAFDIPDEDIVLGYANGYSDIQAEDLDLRNYRGREVHVLGSSPKKQYEAIERLTQPNVFQDPPADIKGVDWNGAHKGAYYGEYWSRDGWQRADHLSIRETVEESLKEVKEFWQARGIWPETEPVDVFGGPTRHPDDPVFAVSGQNLRPRDVLEKATLKEYGGQTYAFESDTARKFFEYREGRHREKN